MSCYGAGLKQKYERDLSSESRCRNTWAGKIWLSHTETSYCSTTEYFEDLRWLWYSDFKTSWETMILWKSSRSSMPWEHWIASPLKPTTFDIFSNCDGITNKWVFIRLVRLADPGYDHNFTHHFPFAYLVMVLVRRKVLSRPEGERISFCLPTLLVAELPEGLACGHLFSGLFLFRTLRIYAKSAAISSSWRSFSEGPNWP